MVGRGARPVGFGLRVVCGGAALVGLGARRAVTSNLGQNKLRRRRSRCDPMQVYDTLPPPIRLWLSQAAIPWSPRECKRIYTRAAWRGETMEHILARLDRAERRTLAREKTLCDSVVKTSEGEGRGP